MGGNLKPGLFLAEEKLSESMHISRGPIREALNRLEKEGFVTIIPRRGTMVSNITAQEVKDISKIRELLEPFAAKESLSRISRSKLKEIKKDFIKLISKPENKENKSIFFLLDKDFHKLLNEECRNKKLIEILDNFEDHTNWFINLFIKNYSFKESIKDHLYIIEAIEKNEEDLVATTLIRHLERVKNSILSEITS
ncbi:MAG: GntR family transcriptional regulator [Candidatus Atribacteria bacterium]|nr:GntR family transcriptional regulator [Candidatus Atribacteria bacterium]